MGEYLWHFWSPADIFSRLGQVGDHDWPGLFCPSPLPFLPHFCCFPNKSTFLNSLRKDDQGSIKYFAWVFVFCVEQILHLESEYKSNADLCARVQFNISPQCNLGLSGRAYMRHFKVLSFSRMVYHQEYQNPAVR